MKPDEESDPRLSAEEGTAAQDDAGGITPLPDDISEIYQDDPPDPAQQ